MNMSWSTVIAVIVLWSLGALAERDGRRGDSVFWFVLGLAVLAVLS